MFFSKNYYRKLPGKKYKTSAPKSIITFEVAYLETITEQPNSIFFTRKNNTKYI